MFALELFHAIAELGQCDTFENLDDRVADFFHDAADAAFLFVGARAFLVKVFANATHWREGAFDQTNNAGEGDFFGRHPEAVPAGEATLAFEDSGGPKIIQDLLQETLWDVLLLGNGVDAEDLFSRVQSQDNQSP